MNKLASLIVLTLASQSLAVSCTAMEGFANGLIARPAHLEPDCGPLYQVFKKGSALGSRGTLRWTEGYHMNGAKAESIIPAITESLKSKGYTLRSKEKEKDNGSVIYSYTNDSIRKIILITIFDPKKVNLIGAAGN